MSRIGALPFPSVPPLCTGSFKIAGLEPNRAWEPCGAVHPRVNADEKAHLQVHAKQQRGLLATRVEIELLTATGAASVHDPETVPVGQPSTSSVPVGCEGVADQFALDARWRRHREFEWGRGGVGLHENLGAAFSECLPDAGDDVASTQTAKASHVSARRARLIALLCSTRGA